MLFGWSHLTVDTAFDFFSQILKATPLGFGTAAWLAGEKQIPATTILAVLLIVGGITGMVILGFPLIAMALGLLILAIFPYLGRYALNTFEKKKRESMAT